MAGACAVWRGPVAAWPESSPRGQNRIISSLSRSTAVQHSIGDTASYDTAEYERYVSIDNRTLYVPSYPPWLNMIAHTSYSVSSTRILLFCILCILVYILSCARVRVLASSLRTC